MATLREIDADLLALEDLLLELGGDVTDEEANAAIDAWLNETQEAVSKKLNGYASLIKELEGRSQIRDAESERLHRLALLDENAAKRLKERLRWFMENRHLPEVQTALFRLRLTKNGGRQAITLTDTVPNEYMMVVREVDYTKIRAALEAGQKLPFARLEERGKHVRIV